LADIEKLGATVIGVSADPIDKLEDFQAQEHAPQRFVADPGGDVIKAYGIDINILGGTKAKRVTFVIGKDGKIVYSYFDWSPLTNVNKTIEWLQAHPQR